MIMAWQIFNSKSISQSTLQLVLSELSKKSVSEQKESFEAWKKEADKGLVEAQFQAGLCYFEGIGVLKSKKSGFHYLKLAADQGNCEAQSVVAFCYEFGFGVEKSYNQAFRYYKLSADQEFLPAQVQLMKFYGEGKGVEKCPEEAHRYFKIIADKDEPSTWWDLAEACESRLELKENAEVYYQKNFNHYKNRADKGDVEAQIIVGECYKNGKGVVKSFERAFCYFQLAANQNSLIGLFNLAECYAEGTGTQKSLETAIHFYQLSADQGYVWAQAALGRCLLAERIDEEKGVHYLKLVVQNAANILPELLALYQYYLGECFEDGIGIEKSAQNAIYYYKLAGENGYPLAFERLAEAYLKGDLGLTKSPDLAIHYLILAANLGSIFAMERLGLCYSRGEGVEQSREMTFHYYKLAGEAGIKERYAPSILKLAECYELGIGTNKSLENAINLYKLAGDYGLAEGYYWAGCCCKKMNKEEYAEKALTFFKLAGEEIPAGHEII